MRTATAVECAIGMSQQCLQFEQRTVFESLRSQLGSTDDVIGCRMIGSCSVKIRPLELPYHPQPIRDVHPTVPTEIDVGAQDARDERVKIGDPIACAVGLDGNGNTGCASANLKSQEEVIVVPLVKPRAG